MSLGTCDLKQYEHSGPHSKIADHGQSLPPFPCQNWVAIEAPCGGMVPGKEFSNGLTPAEEERLAILAEEMGEAIQVIGKILRHGYESRHPFKLDTTVNRGLLMKELGDIKCMLDIMAKAGDVSLSVIEEFAHDHLPAMRPYLHHQGQL